MECTYGFVLHDEVITVYGEKTVSEGFKKKGRIGLRSSDKRGKVDSQN